MVSPAQEKEATERTAAAGPSECRSRQPAEEAAHAVQEMLSTMKHMDPEIVRRLVQARNAAESIHLAFPEGDQRFADMDCDFDEDEDDMEQSDSLDVGSTDPNSGYGAPDEDEEVCYGLLDNALYRSPQICLLKTKEKHDFDIVSDMNAAGLNLIERIRLVNYIRKLVTESTPVEQIIQRARAVISERDEEVLENDSLLIPVIEGDLLLTALETDEELHKDSERGATDMQDAIEASFREENIIP
ncbi:hypothetical protein BWQ96_08257 [Gracilariopsis chorda]|uniref:Uncharacterized protein n=1 Tax=Gracilariopsis chorda TaxID=448386 RepID=A0A2V3IIU9_9FLOR|nr:hypothetical protein BWQ96_08257 [Gracilariopsis chorda]|eukprot:PXF42007.1 hypothetical protein BWQ96_08257 [Gracilariopsis chorda]